MATLSIETREKYSIEIEEELYNKYLNGELTRKRYWIKQEMKFGIVINGQILKNRNFTMKISDLDIETTIEEWEEEKEERYNEAMKIYLISFNLNPNP